MPAAATGSQTAHQSSNPSALRDQRVADFMRAHGRIGAQRCKGWLRLEFVSDLLHQGKARVEVAGPSFADLTVHRRQTG